MLFIILLLTGFVGIRGIMVNVVNANLHKPSRIECNFDGHQPITVTWEKDGGVKLKSTDRITVDGSAVHFKNTEKEDQGRYWCIGENFFSSARSFVNISVYGKGNV